MSIRIGPQASGRAHPNGVMPKTKPTVRAATPAALADVALIDAKQIAAAACIGLSQFYELLKAGKAPQPAIRAPRCSRWRLSEIRQWLEARAAAGSFEGGQ